MASTKERQEFVAMLAREFPKRPFLEVTEFARTLMRHAKTHGRLAAEECNGPGDYIHRIPYPRAGELIAEWQAKLEAKQDRLDARIKAACADFGIKCAVGGDPRGYTVRVFLPSGKGNTWGGSESGWGVPR